MGGESSEHPDGPDSVTDVPAGTPGALSNAIQTDPPPMNLKVSLSAWQAHSALSSGKDLSEPHVGEREGECEVA